MHKGLLAKYTYAALADARDDEDELIITNRGVRQELPLAGATLTLFGGVVEVLTIDDRRFHIRVDEA